tara:strand:- start:3242 stop:3874 length:633 start_codon:yes stop_codon:yes gene_type:complete
MFELGLRLAFDKPTIIVKDDKTSYSFDTSAIEHLEYPRDLRFSQIVEFKEKLADKIRATYKKATTDSNYTTFLKHFGEFKVAKIDKKEVSGQEFILEELKGLKRSISRMERTPVHRKIGNMHLETDIDICLGHSDKSDVNKNMNILLEHPALKNIGLQEVSDNHYHITAEVKSDYPVEVVKDEIDMLVERGKRPIRTSRRKATIEGGIDG